MKKIFAMLAICTMTICASTQAQTTKTLGSTIKYTADTITFDVAPSKIKAFEYVLTKDSGTVAGKVYFEGSIIKNVWHTLDSLALTDVSTAQSKVFTLTSTSYANYRFRCTNTSGAKATAKGAYLRRNDE